MEAIAASHKYVFDLPNAIGGGRSIIINHLALYWYGYKGDLFDNNGSKVMINACQPNSICSVGMNPIIIGNSFDSFMVAVDYYRGG